MPTVIYDKEDFIIRSDSVSLFKSLRLGYITKCFENSFNVYADNWLLNFNTNAEYIHPLSVLIPQNVMQNIREGMNLKFYYPFLNINNMTKRISPLLDIKKHLISIDTKYFRLNVSQLEKALKLFAQRSMVTVSLLDNKKNDFSTVLESVIESLREAYSEGTEFIVDDYIYWFGGGEGLTPAWDDFFCGMILMDRGLNRNIIQISDAGMETLKDRTTSVSYWQIYLALQGKSSIILETMMTRLLQVPLNISDIVKCFKLGATSGADILSGVYTYSNIAMNYLTFDNISN